jgi:hypothetical protein
MEADRDSYVTLWSKLVESGHAALASRVFEKIHKTSLTLARSLNDGVGWHIVDSTR